MKERRRDPRFREENKIVLTLIPEGTAPRPKQTFYSLTNDISMGGIRIMTDAPLPVDSRVKLEITLSKPRKSIQAVARVRWVKDLFGKHVYDMGLEFEEICSADKLVLIDHLYGKGESGG
ncbi:MAG: PilZ domain-containing protein [Candidatus Aminicenantales bacterium]